MKTRNSVCCMEKTLRTPPNSAYLKQGSKEAKKIRENGKNKTSKRGYHPTKEEIHTLAAFAKNTLKRENSEVNKELTNFKSMSVSGNKKDDK